MSNDWRPIETLSEKTVPKSGRLLVYMPGDKDQPVQAAKYHGKLRVVGNQFAFDMHKATHWMPLPAFPEK